MASAGKNLQEGEKLKEFECACEAADYPLKGGGVSDQVVMHWKTEKDGETMSSTFK